MNFIFELKHLRELNLKGCIQLSTETIPFEELTKRETKIPLKRFVYMFIASLDTHRRKLSRKELIMRLLLTLVLF